MWRRVGLVACLLLFAAAPRAQALDKTITVTGEASISVPPDIAVIRAGVTSRGKTAVEASEANAKQMAAVLAALRAQGVAEADIQTSRLSLHPVYEQKRGAAGNAVTGFQAVNQVTVKLHDIAQISSQLDGMLAAGANEVSGIDFALADPAKAHDKIRGEAFKDAQRKAAMLAQAAGGKLGRALTIDEGTRGAMPFSTMVQRAAPPPTPVAPGEETLRAAVTVMFEFTY
jgi:uncharacterized protein YggE